MKRLAALALLAVFPVAVFAETIILEAETPVKLTLNEEVRAKDHNTGDIVELTVAENVLTTDGKILIKQGEAALGILSTSSQVTGVNMNNGNFKTTDSLFIIPVSTRAVNGQKVALTGIASRKSKGPGVGKVMTAVAVGPLFPPAMFLLKKKGAIFKQGTTINAFTRDELFRD